MTYHVEIITADEDLLQIVLKGRISALEIFDLAARCHDQYNAALELWDFSGLKLDLEPVEALRGALALKRSEGAEPKPRRKAFVCGTDAAEMLCRTYVEFVRLERPHIVAEVFGTLDEAKSWLRSGVPRQRTHHRLGNRAGE